MRGRPVSRRNIDNIYYLCVCGTYSAGIGTATRNVVSRGPFVQLDSNYQKKGLIEEESNKRSEIGVYDSVYIYFDETQK